VTVAVDTAQPGNRNGASNDNGNTNGPGANNGQGNATP
jgi:hypothetical protein